MPALLASLKPLRYSGHQLCTHRLSVGNTDELDQMCFKGLREVAKFRLLAFIHGDQGGEVEMANG